MAKTRKFTRKKSNTVKVNNKNYNRQVKKGKIKPKLNRSFQNKRRIANLGLGASQSTNKKNQHENDSDVDVTDMLEDSIITKNVQNKPALKRNIKKRGLEDEDDILQSYEKTPRHNIIEDVTIRHLLPIKDSKGLIQQQTNYENILVEEVEVFQDETNVFEETIIEEPVKVENPEQDVCFVAMYVKRKKDISETKEKVGLICSSIVQDPEENIHKMKDLFALMDEQDPNTYLTYRKIISLSLAEVFKDILPTYKIRQLSLDEKKQRLKKETRKLQEYEQALLSYYKLYLTKLENWITAVKSKTKPDRNVKSKVELNLAILGLKCYSELLLSHPHFNYAFIMVKIIVDRLAHKLDGMSLICCQTISQMFRNDHVGEISYEAMKNIRKIVKMRNYDVPASVLKIFLCLNVKDALVENDNKDENNIKKIRKKMLGMSRKEKQRQKKMKELETELLEAQAEESKKKKSHWQTEILENVFIIYFHIVKNTENMSLLTPVMEGLSKFAHLINIDFFNDLINVLYELIKSGKLNSHESLHCLKTVFTILSGQGESLNIDPQGFYLYLYRLLLDSNVTRTLNKDAELLLDCIEVMISSRRKKMTLQRLLAFTKRLSTVSLHAELRLSLAFMAHVRNWLQQPKVDILLETDNSGSGIYSGEFEDPEHCNANATCLWELSLLRNHYHPAIKKYAEHILERCPSQGKGSLPVKLALKSPKEIYNYFGQTNTLKVESNA